MNNHKEINLLIENREALTELYFKGLEEKEAIKKRLICSKGNDERILNEFTIVDNLIKSIARIVFIQ
jgi:hypothetical protein